MSEAFIKLMAEHRRISILKALRDGGQSNDSILQTVCNDYGISSDRDQIRTTLSWLRDQGLANIRELDNGIMVATPTQSGIDAANGHKVVPGVKRPVAG